MEITTIGSDSIHELKDELIHWLRRYEEKLNEAEELLYRTATAMRQADQTLADIQLERGKIDFRRKNLYLQTRKIYVTYTMKIGIITN
jgi:hypothetical protein